MVRADQVILSVSFLLLAIGTLSAQGKKPAVVGFPHYGLEGASVPLFVDRGQDSLNVLEPKTAEPIFIAPLEKKMNAQKIFIPSLKMDSSLVSKPEIQLIPMDSVQRSVPVERDSVTFLIDSVAAPYTDTIAVEIEVPDSLGLQVEAEPIIESEVDSISQEQAVDSIQVIKNEQAPVVPDSLPAQPKVSMGSIQDSVLVLQDTLSPPQIIETPVIPVQEKDSIKQKSTGQAQGQYSIEQENGVTYVKVKDTEEKKDLDPTFEEKEPAISEPIQRRVNREQGAIIIHKDTTIIHSHYTMPTTQTATGVSDAYSGVSAYERNKIMRMDAEAQRKSLLLQEPQTPSTVVNRVDTVVKIVYVQAPIADVAVPKPVVASIPSEGAPKSTPDESFITEPVPPAPIQTTVVPVIVNDPFRQEKDSLEAARLLHIENRIEDLNARMDTLIDAFGKRQVFPVEELEKAQSSFKLFFSVNSSKISMNQRTAIQSFIQESGDLNGRYVLLTGFTDSSGDAAYNKILSERRANAVKEYLLQLGIPGDRILIDAQGETESNAAYQESMRKVHIEYVQTKPVGQ